MTSNGYSGEPYDVYDDLERTQRQVVLLQQEIEALKDRRNHLLGCLARAALQIVDLRRRLQGQADTIGGYQQSHINLTFQVERLEEQIVSLKKRSLWRRIRNTDPRV